MKINLTERCEICSGSGCVETELYEGLVNCFHCKCPECGDDLLMNTKANKIYCMNCDKEVVNE